MKPLTRKDLDAASCSGPGCTHEAHDGPLFLHARCHPAGRTQVEYQRGVMTVGCGECGQKIIDIKVSES